MIADAEARYVAFISSVDDVDVALRWVGFEEPAEPPLRLVLRFEAEFRNRTPYTLWVEAINTQLYLGGEYAGAYPITEGRYTIPSGERRVVPVQAVLWGKRVELFRSARAGSGELLVVGRARVRIDVGGLERKVFYPVRGRFPLAEASSDADPSKAPDTNDSGTRPLSRKAQGS